MNPITLFIVDENLLTRVAQKKYFESDENFSVVATFKDAFSCLGAIEKTIPDVVLLDTELPDIDGVELTRLIKEKYPKIKIIISTSQKDKRKILCALANGASGYVLKTNQNSDLKYAIQMVMRGEFWLDNEIASLVFCSIQDLNYTSLENLCIKENLENNLTSRELEVLRLMVEGKTNSQIANEIIVSTNTAKAHVGSILNKLCAKDRVQAVVKAVRANIF